MATAACTFGGRSNYNNGWAWKYFNTDTGYGHSGFGKDYYGHNRCIVLKITTPTFDSTWTNRQLQINIPMCRSSAAGTGTDTFYYRVTTTAPTFSEGGKTQITFPTDSICSGSLAIANESAGNGYTMRQMTTVSASFASNTTYYIWIWSDTPYVANSNNYVGYYAHHASYGGLITVNMTYTLVQKSTLSASNGILGTALTLNIAKQVSSYTHTITYACGTASGTICTKSSATSVTWDTSNGNTLALASQNTTGKTVSVTFTIITYNGTTSLGSNTYTVKMTIPSGTSSAGGLSPSCSVSISDANGYFNTYESYIKNKSKLTFTVTMSFQQGAYNQTCTVTVNGQTFKTTSKVTTFTATTNYLTSTGTNTIKVSVTDSRGYTASASATFTVINYTAPTLNSPIIYRSDSNGNSADSGTYAYLNLSISNYSSLNGHNSKTIVIKYWQTADSSTVYTVDADDITNSGDSYTSIAGNGTISVDAGYTFSITVSDDFTSVTRNVSIQSEFVFMEWHKSGKGIAFGKAADTENLFDCALPAKFSGGVNIGSITDVESEITGKVNKAGDTMTGNLYFDCSADTNNKNIVFKNVTTALRQVNIYASSSTSTGSVVLGIYDAANSATVAYYNTSNEFVFAKKINANGALNLPLNSKITWGGLNAGIWLAEKQQMYIRASEENNYVLHFGVADSMWALNPGASGYLNLGTPNYRFAATYSNTYYVHNFLLSDLNTSASAMSLAYGAYVNKYKTNVYGQGIAFIVNDSNGTDGTVLSCFKESTGSLRTIFRSDTNGGAYLGTTSYRWNTGFFTNTITQSDRKTKENFKEVEKAIEFVMALNPQMYTLKNSDSENPRWHVGLIAQDVAATAKELGLGDLSLYQAAIVDEDGNELPYVEGTDDEKLSWGLNYQEIIPYLVKAFQGIYTEITELKEKQYG